MLTELLYYTPAGEDVPHIKTIMENRRKVSKYLTPVNENDITDSWIKQQ